MCKSGHSLKLLQHLWCLNGHLSLGTFPKLCDIRYINVINAFLSFQSALERRQNSGIFGPDHHRSSESWTQAPSGRNQKHLKVTCFLSQWEFV